MDMREAITLQVDIYDLKGIRVGDWVESAYLKGYFKVSDIKRSYCNGNDIGYLLLLKKAFTPAMKFSFSTEKCHVAWCEKLSESKIGEIERLLEDNPKRKKKLDEMPLMFPCIQDLYFLEIGTEKPEKFEESLKELPRYFSREQFDHFISQVGWRKYLKSNSDDPKNAITLTIYTQEWIVDAKKDMLFCNPQIGKRWGTLAKLDAEAWNDF